MFFTGTAGIDGTVNISPKGLDSFKVMGPNRAIWLNLTGSGNETAAQILELNRITLMFCSFEADPLILRLYGSAKIYHPGDSEWEELIGSFPPMLGSRQIFDMQIDLVQTSCGFGVPFYAFEGQRDGLATWAGKKGEEGILAYQKLKNSTSLDGKPTDIPPA